MTNSYYTPDGQPNAQSRGTSINLRNEFALIQAGFGILPAPSTLAGDQQNYGVDTGTASAIVLPFPSNITVATDGMQLTFRVAAAPTGSTTITLGSLGSAPLTRTDGTSIQVGDYNANQIVEVRYSSLTSSYQLSTTGISASSQAVASAVAAAASATAAAASLTAVTAEVATVNYLRTGVVLSLYQNFGGF